MEQENEENIIEKEKFIREGWTGHLAPCGAKNMQAFCGVILKSERPTGALFTNSGPPFLAVQDSSITDIVGPLIPWSVPWGQLTIRAQGASKSDPTLQ